MGKVDEVLAEMRQERERLVAELARVDRVIAALEERQGATVPPRVTRSSSKASAGSDWARFARASDRAVTRVGHRID